MIALCTIGATETAWSSIGWTLVGELSVKHRSESLDVIAHNDAYIHPLICPSGSSDLLSQQKGCQRPVREEPFPLLHPSWCLSPNSGVDYVQCGLHDRVQPKAISRLSGLVTT